MLYGWPIQNKLLLKCRMGSSKKQSGLLVKMQNKLPSKCRMGSSKKQSGLPVKILNKVQNM